MIFRGGGPTKSVPEHDFACARGSPNGVDNWHLGWRIHRFTKDQRAE